MSKSPGRIEELYLTLYRKLFPHPGRVTPDSVVWAYRLLLGREPETTATVMDKISRLSSPEELRREIIQSQEFREKNPDCQPLSLFGHEPPMSIENVSAVELDRLFSHIQRVWENLGETEPHWSVLSSDEFKASAFADHRQAFYDTGSGDVSIFLKTLTRNNIDAISLKSCLEFGCGVGRVTAWLARDFEKVTAYDISRSHLRLAQQYLDESGLTNVVFHHIEKPGSIENFPKVDAVYSLIVLQHNPPPVIREIVRQMLRALNPGGVAFFQVPTYCSDYRFSIESYLAGIAHSNHIEMHVLPQSEIFAIVAQEQCQLVEVREDSAIGFRAGERSNTFLVQKH